jgi:hypothetical protein
LAQLETLQHQLFAILRCVIEDHNYDKISPESFQSFTFPWEVAIATVWHREMLLAAQRPTASSTASHRQHVNQAATSSVNSADAE